MFQMQLFKYEEENAFKSLTVLDIDGEPWFVASEVCEILDIKDVTSALRFLDPDEKLLRTVGGATQNREKNTVNESGMYALIFRSQKPEAKRFRKWVTSEVIPSIRKTGSYSLQRQDHEKPVFIQRYQANLLQVERGYFSVITELYIRLHIQFEKHGYVIPNKSFSDGKEIRPDVSVGRRFSEYLEDNYPNEKGYCKEYKHVFPNGIKVPCRQYRNALLPLFIWYVDNVWIPMYAQDYFQTRDKVALDYLPKLLA